MQEKGFPWDSVDGDRPFSAQDMADAYAGIMSDGKMSNDDFDVRAMTSGNVIIDKGEAWIGGHHILYPGGDIINIPYTAAQSAPVYGMIVLKCDNAKDSRKFYFYYKVPENGIDAEAGENEIPIAKIQYDRGGDSVNKLSVINRLTAPQNIKLSSKTKVDQINGLLSGKNGELVAAIPWDDFAHPDGGGSFKKDIYINSNPLMYAKEYNTNKGDPTWVTTNFNNGLRIEAIRRGIDLDLMCVLSGDYCSIFGTNQKIGMNITNVERIDGISCVMIADHNDTTLNYTVRCTRPSDDTTQARLSICGFSIILFGEKRQVGERITMRAEFLVTAIGWEHVDPEE